MTTWKKAQQMANPTKHAYYMERVRMFETMADKALAEKDWSVVKWANKMFNHYMNIAREFEPHWIEYKLIMGWA